MVAGVAEVVGLCGHGEWVVGMAGGVVSMVGGVVARWVVGMVGKNGKTVKRSVYFGDIAMLAVTKHINN